MFGKLKVTSNFFEALVHKNCINRLCFNLKHLRTLMTIYIRRCKFLHYIFMRSLVLYYLTNIKNHITIFFIVYHNKKNLLHKVSDSK